MTLANNRKIINVIIVCALLLSGWGVYSKQTTLIIIGLVSAGLLAVFEEIIIRWF